MEFPTDFATVGRELQLFLIHKGGTLPAFTRDKVVEAAGSPSPVDTVVKSAEALYAARADLDPAGKTVLAQLAQFAAMGGYHGMGVDNRGGRIAQAMQRELGEVAPAGKWPEPETDPDPDPSFVAPPPPPPAEAEPKALPKA